jgi:chorismate dehydratase
VGSLKIRLSLVDYLNTAPLGWSFLYGPHKNQFEIFPASPARCADQLAAGEVEIGLIPSIEYQRIPDLRIIPGMAIASSSQVRSVIMVRHRGREIRSVALDTSSRTSVVLLKLLLCSKMGLDPVFQNHPPDVARMLEACDAALLIGDAALQVSPDEYDFIDLAEAWIGWQQRPFVFAFWACRNQACLPDNLADIFEAAKQWGLKARSDIVQSYSSRLNLPEPFLHDYLFHKIDYDMAAPHINGLERFYQLACSAGLISNLEEIRFLSAGAMMRAPFS